MWRGRGAGGVDRAPRRRSRELGGPVLPPSRCVPGYTIFIPFSLIPRALRSTQHTDLTKEGADYIELVFGPLRKPGQVPLLYKNVMY